jgi:archaemetzincin
MAGIDIVPMYFNDRNEMLRRLGSVLEREFRTTVRYRNPWFDPEAAFDSSRGQYRASFLLKALLNDQQEEPAERILGVTGVDLFTPVLTYVFGEAQLGGRAASFRPSPAKRGLWPSGSEASFERLRKEASTSWGTPTGSSTARIPAA